MKGIWQSENKSTAQEQHNYPSQVLNLYARTLVISHAFHGKHTWKDQDKRTTIGSNMFYECPYGKKNFCLHISLFAMIFNLGLCYTVIHSLHSLRMVSQDSCDMVLFFCEWFHRWTWCQTEIQTAVIKVLLILMKEFARAYPTQHNYRRVKKINTKKSINISLR